MRVKTDLTLKSTHMLKYTHSPSLCPEPDEGGWWRAPLSLPRGICSRRYRKLAKNSILRLWCRWKDRLWRHMYASVFLQRFRWAWWRAWNSMLGRGLEDIPALCVSPGSKTSLPCVCVQHSEQAMCEPTVCVCDLVCLWQCPYSVCVQSSERVVCVNRV